MKKVCALLLAAVLLLSLASCSSGRNHKNNDGSMSKKEMLNVTEKAPVNEIADAKKEDISDAENTYIGAVYSFTGHVAKIAEDHIELIPYGYFDTVIAYMSENDIRGISENELINIVGEISELDCGETVLAELGCSYYVDNTVSVHGWVSSIEETESGEYIACIVDLPYRNNKKILWKFNLDSAKKTGEDNNKNDVFRGKYGKSSISNGTFVTIKCSAEFTYFDSSAELQGSESCVQINRIVKLSTN